MSRIAMIGMLAIASLSTLAPAMADPATELRRLQKCYGLFVRQHLPVTDPLWIAVSVGGMSGTDACMAVFDSAKLDSSGKIAKDSSTGNYNERGARVLASFLELHRTQVTVPEYLQAIDNNLLPTMDVIDANTSGYHYLYSLFKPNEPFSSIVKRNYGMQSVRFTNRSGARARTVLNINNMLNIRMGDDDTSGQASTLQTWTSVKTAATGILVGVTPATISNALPVPPRNGGFSNYQGVDVMRHFGAGVLGEQAHLLGNNDKFGPVDGGVNSYRLWSKNVLSDLLCRELPALRSSDVVAMSMVETTSALSYRQGLSCMACHGTMDPMAGVLRNLRRGFSARVKGNGFVGVTFFLDIFDAVTPPARMASAPYPVLGPDSNFSKRPPEGQLLYRSYDGTLVNQSLTGLQDLGDKLAQTNDLYVCQASRYYQYLTGLSANLADLNDPLNAPDLTASQLKVRENVINMGLQLKQHQSLRTLIKSIIATPEFIDPDHGV